MKDKKKISYIIQSEMEIAQSNSLLKFICSYKRFFRND
jgi:hypothetical protein